MGIEIKIVGSTNNFKTKGEFLEFGATSARVCYSKHNWEKLKQEDKNELIQRTLNSGHHSVYGHASLNLYLDGIPKLLAMVLNNQGLYNSSEKSARYTIMNEINPEQRKLYDKWNSLFKLKIKEEYPKLSQNKINSLSKENARYMTSVFTPTKMIHSVNFRQLNYIMHWFNNFINNNEDNFFNSKLKSSMKKFNTQLDNLYVKELKPEEKHRNLRLLTNPEINTMESFSENYSIHYSISLAGLAQLQRHRPIRYEIEQIQDFPKDFFIPKILLKTKHEKEWINDLEYIAKKDLPQATLVKIYEKGNYTDLISKVGERLCGHAQFEAMQTTKEILKKYLKNTKENYPSIYDILKKYSNKPKCSFVKCTSPCEFDSENKLNRSI